MSSINNIVKRLHESRIDEASNYKGYKLKWEADDKNLEPHVVIYSGNEKVASAADVEEAKSIIDNDLNESQLNEQDNLLSDMRANSTYKKIESICAKYDYKLFYAYREKYGSHIDTTITIRETQEYQPEIYYQNSFGQDNYEFKIQTSAHGALNLGEHKKYLNSVKGAHDLVVELSKIDFSDLLLIEKEE